MSVKVTVRQVQEQFAELRQRAVETGDAGFGQQDGRDYAVIVGVREWKRRRIGTNLNSLGPAYRLTKVHQHRAEELLAGSSRPRLHADPLKRVSYHDAETDRRSSS